MFSFYKSTIGKKIIVAVTGIVLVMFVLGHVAGNLKVFFGMHDGIYAIDKYGELLREIGSDFLGKTTFLWLVRFGLLGAVILHIVTVIQLQIINKGMKSQGYDNQVYRAAKLPARLMLLGGIILLIFIIFHILHLTTGHLHFDGFVEGQIFDNLYGAFQHWYLVLFYVVSMFFLMLHLHHGIWSVFQTLGFLSPTNNNVIKYSTSIISVLVFIGFISVPVAIYFNLIPRGF